MFGRPRGTELYERNSESYRRGGDLARRGHPSLPPNRGGYGLGSRREPFSGPDLNNPPPVEARPGFNDDEFESLSRSRKEELKLIEERIRKLDEQRNIAPATVPPPSGNLNPLAFDKDANMVPGSNLNPLAFGKDIGSLTHSTPKLFPGAVEPPTNRRRMDNEENPPFKRGRMDDNFAFDRRRNANKAEASAASLFQRRSPEFSNAPAQRNQQNRRSRDGPDFGRTGERPYGRQRQDFKRNRSPPKGRAENPESRKMNDRRSPNRKSPIRRSPDRRSPKSDSLVKKETPEVDETKDKKPFPLEEMRPSSTILKRLQKAGIPPHLIRKPYYCHFCGTVSENKKGHGDHVNSDSHMLYVKKREEQLRKQLENQHEAYQKTLEGHRKKGTDLSFCTTCMLYYAGLATKHKRHASHRMRMHSHCVECKINIPTRFDYEVHIVGLNHIRNKMYYMIEAGLLEDDLSVPDEYDRSIVGLSNVVDTRGLYCKVCDLFFTRDFPTAPTKHCMSLKHYNSMKMYAERKKLDLPTGTKHRADEAGKEAGWTCPGCGFSNVNFRDECHRCKTKKPDDENVDMEVEEENVEEAQEDM